MAHRNAINPSDSGVYPAIPVTRDTKSCEKLLAAYMNHEPDRNFGMVPGWANKETAACKKNRRRNTRPLPRTISLDSLGK